MNAANRPLIDQVGYIRQETLPHPGLQEIVCDFLQTDD
jgi:hypothetical protein